MLDHTTPSANTKLTNKEPSCKSFVTPCAERKRDLKSSEKYDSTLRKQLVRDSAQLTNFESPVPAST